MKTNISDVSKIIIKRKRCSFKTFKKGYIHLQLERDYFEKAAEIIKKGFSHNISISEKCHGD